MPELPEVETTLKGIHSHVESQVVDVVKVREFRLRWPIPQELPELLKSQTVLGVFRRAKYLLFKFSQGHLLLHLGMSGRLQIVASNQPPQKHDHLDIVFKNGQSLRFTDPRRFGAALWAEGDPYEHKLLKHLGPEPFSEQFNGDYLFQLSRKRKVPIKSFLMDSKVVAGVGNIYANEALYLSGIRPNRQTGSVSRERYRKLSTEVVGVLSRAVEAGGTTLKDFVGGDGKPGYFKQELNVYGRGSEPCLNCAKPLIEIRMGQRSTVYCNRCQR